MTPSAIEEVLPPGPPAAAAEALALAKARAVAATTPGAVVVGADTIVVLDGEILGKPRDAAEATLMLRRLRGRTHEVITAVAVVSAGAARERATSVQSRDTMADYTDADIEGYVATGEPFDKAGGYAVQAGGARLVRGVEGCLTNVVGLPVRTTRRLLASFGVNVLEES